MEQLNRYQSSGLRGDNLLDVNVFNEELISRIKEENQILPLKAIYKTLLEQKSQGFKKICYGSKSRMETSRFSKTTE